MSMLQDNPRPAPPPSWPDYSGIYEQVREEFACDHPSAVLTRFVKVNNACEFRRQCTRCGENLGAVKKSTLTTAELDRIKPYDKALIERRRQEWRDRYEELKAEREEEHAELKSQYDEAMSRYAEERKHQYASYLRTPKWIRKRQLVIDRARGKCEGCRQFDATEVHHLTYEHIGDEFLFELVALCDRCHRRVHGRSQQ